MFFGKTRQMLDSRCKIDTLNWNIVQHLNIFAELSQFSAVLSPAAAGGSKEFALKVEGTFIQRMKAEI